MSGDEDQLETTSTLLLTGASQSISDTIIDRFTGAIAVAAGATVAESGLINGGRQLGLNLPQVLFGGLADTFGKRRVIAGGRLLSSVTLAAMVFVNAPGWLLPLIIATSICTSMVIPSWGSLLGDYSGSTKRGTVITRINSVAQAGGFAAMIIAFAVTFTQTGPMTKTSFNLLLAIASASSLVSAILVGYTKENPPRKDRAGFELGLLVQRCPTYAFPYSQLHLRHRSSSGYALLLLHHRGKAPHDCMADRPLRGGESCVQYAQSKTDRSSHGPNRETPSNNI